MRGATRHANLMTSPLVTLIATRAQDTLVDEAGIIIKIQEGGPALFLRSAFDAMKVAYDFQSPEIMDVEILITPKDEFGRMKHPVPALSIDGRSISTPALVVSTILDEVSLDALSSYTGKLFLDVQGYVRDGKEFGKKKEWEPTNAVSESIFAIKATEQELKYIPAELVACLRRQEAQKKKLLLVTKGEKGCDVYSCGKEYSVVPSRAVKAKDTIGAGDTFFGSFIAEFLKTGNPELSAQVAQKTVEKFLQQKEG